jgi:hypothetical protein
MRVALCLVAAASTGLSVSTVFVWPGLITTLLCLGSFGAFLFLKVKPTPCWWFTAATLGLVAAATFLFNRFVAPPGAMLISPVGYVVGSAVVLALEYRGRQVVLEQVEMKK